MSNRPGPLTREQQVQIGLAVADSRATGVPWKEIERQFDMERTWLWRCMRLLGKQQKTRDKQHHGGCQPD